ncbi:hypothetical protein HYC85_008059 [Camellia sinensis]|uniref:Uncharacterized protein n=1 Tax=Camellia sinensis TaxID=4442 RepID=A0A7J7HQT2_CAMSI|nr:hypothetical protein HYC85_008059 [Camellia sinensis]
MNLRVPKRIYSAAMVSYLVEPTLDPAAAVAGTACFLDDAREHLSFLSSWFICCCLHSRLQKALSPLQNSCDYLFLMIKV